MFDGKGQGFFNLCDRHVIVLSDFGGRHVPLLRSNENRLDTDAGAAQNWRWYSARAKPIGHK